MSFAVNASTIGMAAAGIVVGFLSPHIDRRLGILVSLVLLAIPTALLASAPDLAVFTIDCEQTLSGQRFSGSLRQTFSDPLQIRILGEIEKGQDQKIFGRKRSRCANACGRWP